MIDEHASLDEVRALFAKDRFASLAGCMIEQAGKGRAVCTMPLEERHLNAQGGVMGGAIFTLADFALAVAVNVGQPGTVAVENSIRYLAAPKGSKLIAEAVTDKPGRTLAFVTVTISDDTGRTVAIMTSTACRTSH